MRKSAEAARRLEREIKKAERDLKATAAEKNFASGIAAGIYTAIIYMDFTEPRR